MKRLLSIRYSAGAFNVAILLFRLGLGILMMHHGYQKLTNFNQTARQMPAMMGISGTVIAALLVFAEFFCSLFLILGLFTRFAVIPLIISCSVALVKIHNMEVFGAGEMISLFLLGYIVLLFLGPGKVSVDSMIGK